MAVALWQVIIFAAIVGASRFLGNRGLAWSAGLASVWTVFMVFTSWLMLLQFVTIAIAGLVGSVICDERLKRNGVEAQTRNWKALIGTGQLFLCLAVVGGASMLYLLNPEHFRSSGLGSLGMAAAYGGVLLGGSVVGGAAYWLLAGLLWKHWSVASFRMGGVVCALGVALVVAFGDQVTEERQALLTSAPTIPVRPQAQVESRNPVVSPAPSSLPRSTADDSYGRLVSKYERSHPQFDPASTKYDAELVNRTLMRATFYQFVDREPAEQALQRAIHDAFLPSSAQISIHISKNNDGSCRYDGRGNRRFVSLDGPCPRLRSGYGLR